MVIPTGKLVSLYIRINSSGVFIKNQYFAGKFSSAMFTPYSSASLIDFLDALAHVFEVGARIKLPDSCALSGVEDPDFCVHFAGVFEGLF